MVTCLIPPLHVTLLQRRGRAFGHVPVCMGRRDRARSPIEGEFDEGGLLSRQIETVLLTDGKPASAWILARYSARLTEQELDLLRAHYQLDDALTTGQIAEKYHVTGQVVLERRHAAARRLGRLIAWELDEPSRRAELVL